MAGIESEVLSTFLGQMKESGEVPAELVEHVGAALSQVKLPKPDDLADLYAAGSGDRLA